MAEPVSHESLTDRAKNFYAHLHQIVLVGKGAALVAIGVGVVFVLIEVYAAIKHSAETKQEQKIAQTVPQTIKDAPLEHHLFKPDQKPLKPHTFRPKPTKTGDPLPKPPSPDATPANLHPEITTATADSGPVATVFDPESPKEASEISTRFGIDLDKYFLASQKKKIPPLENGATGWLVIPAGGGQVEFIYLEDPRPTFDFKPAFKLGFGMHRTWNDPGKTAKTPNEPSQVQGFHLMAGLEPMRIGGAHTELLTFLNYDKARDKPLNGSALVNVYWLFK